MSVFLTPKLKPFVGGTYFPPQDQYGRPGFATLLKSIAKEVRSRDRSCNPSMRSHDLQMSIVVGFVLDIIVS